jgi:hypothetical protein
MSGAVPSAGDDPTATPLAARHRRPPPKKVKVLLPVWGARYLKQFVDVGLPTLLAPGNLPAIAKTLPCEFVLLTSNEDAEQFAAHPAYAYLQTICDTRLESISDLITGDNYSTTITLAFERAVRATGLEMTDTCFFFLISDYLIADGSLANALARMQAGVSGLLAGNFQVAGEDAARTFRRTFDRGGPSISLPARQLVKWALEHLHPMTVANMADFPLVRSTHSNRLFWSVDEDTIIGRFYLMHMLCIRPEVTDFVIGSSCDYSFIPEMCPSGNVEALTDSDEYLVVEMQPTRHERGFLRLGPVTPQSLARSLSEWTTAGHRDNARHQLVFHGADIPDAVHEVGAQADAFLAQVNRRLTRQPQPYRDHRYWIGALSAHKLAVSRISGAPIDRRTLPVEARPQALMHWLRDIALGRPPKVTIWHPRWPDYRQVTQRLRRLLAGTRGRLCIVSMAAIQVDDWLAGATSRKITFRLGQFMRLKAEEYMPLVGQFDGCLLLLSDEELKRGRAALARLRPLLAPEGFILVFTMNNTGVVYHGSFDDTVAVDGWGALHLGMRVSDITFVTAGQLRWSALHGMVALYRRLLSFPLVYWPLLVTTGPLLAVGSLLGNLLCLKGRPTPGRRHPTSIHMVLRSRSQEVRLPHLGPDIDLFANAHRYAIANAALAACAPTRAEQKKAHKICDGLGSCSGGSIRVTRPM